MTEKADKNCIQVIFFYGHRGELIEKMAKTCECDMEKATEFVDKYLHFLTEDLLQKLKEATSEVEPALLHEGELDPAD